jgi:hypothetical protein
METASHEKASLLYNLIQTATTSQQAKETIDPINMALTTP